jgi:hypothetical protein
VRRAEIADVRNIYNSESCPLLAAFLAFVTFLLNGGARDRPIGTEDAAITFFRFEYCAAIGTFVKVLASICRHRFFFLMTTLWASYDGL